MKVLIIGSGAREHAIAWKLNKSNLISGLYIAPGNAGTDALGTNLPINPMDFDEIKKACRENGIQYVIVGPEDPLSAGIVDDLSAEGLKVLGPHRDAAKLESSKTFSKQFMKRYNIPTAEAVEFDDKKKLKKYITEKNGKWVVKKNGLAAGKGVLESENKAELISFGMNILKNDTLLVEEFLEGYEISLFALSDGKNYLVLPPCSDFKKAKEGDTGPNTGGMGSICPVPWVDSELNKKIIDEIVVPTFNGMNREGLNYKGVLFFGLMITEKGPKVLEYNVRFGDPETQAFLPLIDADFGNLLEAMMEGTLDMISLKENPLSSVCVVVASQGYPASYKKGVKVKPIPEISEEKALIFHASTVLDKNGDVLTGGGRCFSVVGMDEDLITAASRAYNAVQFIQFDGAWCRKDIAKKFFVDEES
ncbi:MAG: phosphoribosylamine--glycine ligase [Spirochaetales bacterium]|nr:phosphoribosylamine--glycine ligase [Spirochaetales bacterium]